MADDRRHPFSLSVTGVKRDPICDPLGVIDELGNELGTSYPRGIPKPINAWGGVMMFYWRRVPWGRREPQAVSQLTD